jgi:hypothetical protein
MKKVYLQESGVWKDQKSLARQAALGDASETEGYRKLPNITGQPLQAKFSERDQRFPEADLEQASPLSIVFKRSSFRVFESLSNSRFLYVRTTIYLSRNHSYRVCHMFFLEDL